MILVLSNLFASFNFIILHDKRKSGILVVDGSLAAFLGTFHTNVFVYTKPHTQTHTTYTNTCCHGKFDFYEIALLLFIFLPLKYILY